MAQVSHTTWDAFLVVNNLYEMGKLKDQKFSQAELAKGTLALKQWHMKPLVSLPDDSKLCLLKKVRKVNWLIKKTERNFKLTSLVSCYWHPKKPSKATCKNI